MTTRKLTQEQRRLFAQVGGSIAGLTLLDKSAVMVGAIATIKATKTEEYDDESIALMQEIWNLIESKKEGVIAARTEMTRHAAGLTR